MSVWACPVYVPTAASNTAGSATSDAIARAIWNAISDAIDDAIGNLMNPNDEQHASAPTALDPDAVASALAKVVAQLDGGEVRPGQLEMTRAVAEALSAGQHLSVEAGTGVGKSLAYLVPAVLSGQRVVLTTATKVLQDQLADKDIPQVSSALATELRELLGRPLRHAVVKGRSNYACLLRLDQHTSQQEFPELPNTPAEKARAKQLEKVVAWTRRTKSGDKAELEFEPEANVWRQVSATGSECIGRSKCAFGDRCFSELAREHAATADVVITNHHLYALVAKMIGGGVLPEHDVVIIDEAHQLEDSVTSAVGVTLTPGALRQLAQRANRIKGKGVLDGPDDKQRIKSLQSLASVLHDELEAQFDQRVALDSPDDGIAEVLRRIDGAVEVLYQSLDGESAADLASPVGMLKHELSQTLIDVRKLLEAPDDYVAYVAGRNNAPVLNTSPIVVADFLTEHLWGDRTAILTSATIGSYLPVKLGLADQADHKLAQIQNTFDYENNSLLYCARHLPEPNDSSFREQAIEVMTELINAAGGRTLALFTSWKALNETADALETRLGSGIAVLRQSGDLTNAQLLDALIDDPAKVICATLSFWQGVDIPGPALSLVTIDRLPFMRYGEPVTSAREDAVKDAGGNPFMEVQVPHAATLLAQGIGRLIRSSTDRGVVAVLDSRLATKHYRAHLLESVPAGMPRSVDLSQAVERLQHWCAS